MVKKSFVTVVVIQEDSSPEDDVSLAVFKLISLIVWISSHYEVEWSALFLSCRPIRPFFALHLRVTG